MQATALEAQIVQGLAGVAALAVSAGITVLTSHAKAWLRSHTNANVSQLSNDVIDGFSKTADAVVHDFNDRIVREAQTNGVLTPELFAQVKIDAMKSVMDQASSLVALGTKLGLDVQGLALSVVAQSFNQIGVTPSVRSVADVLTPAAAPASPAVPTAPAAPTSPTAPQHVHDPASIGGAQA